MNDDLTREARIHDLAAECLECFAAEGDTAIERICAQSPDLMVAVRGVLRQLDRLGLIHETAAVPRRDVGDFRLLRVLGEGAMGVVWLAEQQSLSRRVALKLLRPGSHHHQRSRERFRREVQALSKLDHPNICPVYEAGEVDGVPYLAMRYVEGESLASALVRRRHREAGSAERRWSPRPILDDLTMIEKLARALHSAHQSGVVHRDVKPGNVLLQQSGEPMLVDFGLAQADDPALATLTRTGDALGTPAYMSPEQVAGGEVDARSDVYSLGATLYECATLRPPFRGDSRESLYQSILRDPVPDPRRANRAVGRDLRAVLDKTLEKDPQRRFATALEFAEELRRIREREPILTRPIGPALRTKRWCQRNRMATATLAVVITALVTTLAMLQRSILAETRWKAQAFLAAAEAVRPEQPELAFKLAREALRLHADDPRVMAYVQEVMFDLRAATVLRSANVQLSWAEFSPDGRLVIVTGNDQLATVHRRDGTELGRLPVQRGYRPPLAFAPDGRAIAAADREGLLRLYDVSEHGVTERRTTAVANANAICYGKGEAGPLLVTHDDGSASLCSAAGEILRYLVPTAADTTAPVSWAESGFLPDGSIVAASNIWQPDGTFAPLIGHTAKVLRLAVGSETIATAGDNNTIALWGFDGRLLKRIELPVQHATDVRSVRSLSFSPTGDILLASFLDGAVMLWNGRDGAFRCGWQTDGAVRSAFTADGQHVVTGNWRGRVESWDFDGRRLWTATGHQGGISSVTCSPSSGTAAIVSTGWDGTARLWHLTPRSDVMQVTGLQWPSLAVVGNGVALIGNDGVLALCDAEGREAQARIDLGVPLTWPTTGADGKLLVPSRGGSIWSWQPGSGEAPSSLAARVVAPGPVWSVLRLAGGALVASTESAPSPWFCDSDTGQFRPLGLNGMASCTSRDGSRCFVGTADGQVIEIDANGAVQGDPIQVPERVRVGKLALSPDDRWLLAPTTRGLVHVIDLTTRQVTAPYPGHRHSVYQAVFSPSGTRIATASFDGTSRVWTAGSSAAALVLHHPSALETVAFVANDRIVTACKDGAVRWWAVTPSAVQAAVARVAIPGFTAAEHGLPEVAALLAR